MIKILQVPKDIEVTSTSAILLTVKLFLQTSLVDILTSHLFPQACRNASAIGQWKENPSLWLEV